ncbi:MAG: FMN-binding protein, partial [Clostridia bacterium]|nr:FMN-binding protein [Clostridia bacterium]
MKKLSTLLALVLALMFLCVTASAASYAAGTYEAEGQGNNGPVKLSVTFSDDAITAIDVIEHAETAGLSDPAFATIPDAVIANQSLAVDTVSGATNSSNAILTAIADAVAQAGGDVDALKAVEIEKAEATDIEATY